jgi:threonine dehydrogenase-like Zn-dependent dehydrogenase
MKGTVLYGLRDIRSEERDAPNGKINAGKVFELTLPLDQVAEGYRAMDERRAIKTLLRPAA